MRPKMKFAKTRISEKVSLRSFFVIHGYSERRKLITKSKVAKMESIPITISITKKIIAQILLPGSILSMAGYATKASSMPSISISSIPMSKVVETWPRKAKSTIAAKIEVALLIIGNQSELRRIFSSGFLQLE